MPEQRIVMRELCAILRRIELVAQAGKIEAHERPSVAQWLNLGLTVRAGQAKLNAVAVRPLSPPRRSAANRRST